MPKGKNSSDPLATGPIDWGVYPEWDPCWGRPRPRPINLCNGPMKRVHAERLAEMRSQGLPLGRRYVARKWGWQGIPFD